MHAKVKRSFKRWSWAREQRKLEAEFWSRSIIKANALSGAWHPWWDYK